MVSVAVWRPGEGARPYPAGVGRAADGLACGSAGSTSRGGGLFFVGVAPPEAEGSRPSGSQRLPRASRLRLSNDVQGLFERGKRKRTAHLDVYFAASPVSRPRLGVLVPKHRRTVAQRNRLKRRLRELGRTRMMPALRAAARSVDVMVRARPEAYLASIAQLGEEIDAVVMFLCSGPSSLR